MWWGIFKINYFLSLQKISSSYTSHYKTWHERESKTFLFLPCTNVRFILSVFSTLIRKIQVGSKVRNKLFKKNWFLNLNLYVSIEFPKCVLSPFFFWWRHRWFSWIIWSAFSFKSKSTYFHIDFTRILIYCIEKKEKKLLITVYYQDSW